MPYFPSVITKNLNRLKHNYRYNSQKTTPIRLMENGLLDLTVSPNDAIARITARNNIESPLLHLPAEIRNRIFALALGGYHIHVFYNSLNSDSLSNPFFGYTVEITTKTTKRQNQIPFMPKPSPDLKRADWMFSNRVYADHNACFHPPNSRQLVKLAGVKPWDIARCGEERMTLVARTCRQIYAETALICYELSTFSFGPGALGQWMKNRAEGQKQVIRALHAEYYNLGDKFHSYFSKNPNVVIALQPDTSPSRMPFLNYAGLRKIYVSKELLRSLYAPRCNCHGWYDYDIDGLDLEVRKKIFVRLCNRRKRELEEITQGSVDVIVLE
ncbi:hypothetical protein AOQ84DRAFT_358289 [Glonium stellatum]|uniref:DUF7730 domain-containing protein n=1 Tax=Glonium stellatum TaxID=574774 RepID=A0A8E2FDT6_9PEZI|nr:hypothetical protein AOQ84DRAFT_358289 [Glonium stellatum]